MNYKKPRRDGNNRYMRCKVEDLTGAVECVMWAEEFARCKDEIAEDRVVFVKGTVERTREEPSLVLSRVYSVDQASREMAKNLNLLMHLGRSRPVEIDALAEILKRSPGPVPVLLTIRDPQGRLTILKLGRSFSINPQTFDQDALENLLGSGSVKLT
jgi:DNA polymerase-3 subunit alpha